MTKLEAISYIARAIQYAGLGVNDNWTIGQLVVMLERYDEIEPLSEAEVRVVIEVVIESHQSKMKRIKAHLN